MPDELSAVASIEALFDEYEAVDFPPAARSYAPLTPCPLCAPHPCFSVCPGLN